MLPESEGEMEESPDRGLRLKGKKGDEEEEAARRRGEGVEGATEAAQNASLDALCLRSDRAGSQQAESRVGKGRGVKRKRKRAVGSEDSEA